MREGQVAIVHSKRGFSPWLIRLVTRSYWSHAIIAISETECVSAEPDGARQRPISDYTDLAWSQFPLTLAELQTVADYAIDHLGTPYSWFDFYACGIAALLKKRTPRFILDRAGSADAQICSQLADNALLAAGVSIFANDRPIGAATPATFGKYFVAHGWTDKR